jgi:hypothetical protein
MDTRIKIEENILKYIFEQESKKIVGICMKRFEIHNNPEDQKKAIKEALYENLRNILDLLIINGKEGISLTNTK